MGISRLEEKLSVNKLVLPRRTLQRRLDQLLAAEKIRATGGSRSIVYHVIPTQLRYKTTRSITHIAAQQPVQLMPQEPTEQTMYDSIVPLSAAGLEVRNYVRQPLAARKPVGYLRSLLAAYQPNKDSYLSAAQCQKLADLGQMLPARLPAGTYARDVLDRLLIDLSWASSKLEGNTYTRFDTARLIEYGQVAEGKGAEETQMILNHKAAIELLIENASQISLDRFTILNLHAILADNLIADPHANGRLRTRAVQIIATVFVPLAIPQQLMKCFDLILTKAAKIKNPFEQAFFCMVHLPYLQPFEDVNKRVSRLAANIPLIRNNLCPLSFIDVPERLYVEAILGVYELNRVALLRDVFMWAYERSCQRYLAIRQSVGEPDAFRFQYREAIQHVVQAIIRGNLKGTSTHITHEASDTVTAFDMEPFIEAVTQDLDNLYEGNYARYRLKLSEFKSWKHKRATR